MQTFAFTLEWAWNTLKNLLDADGLTEHSPPRCIQAVWWFLQLFQHPHGVLKQPTVSQTSRLERTGEPPTPVCKPGQQS